MAGLGKGSVFSSIIAAICILIYIAAIAFGAVRIILNVGERQNMAKNEFDAIADRATVLALSETYMSDAYKQVIYSSLYTSRTPILALIFNSPSGTYYFETIEGSGIVWSGNTPRLRTGAGYPNIPLELSLRIDGQRAVNLTGTYSYIGYDFFILVLRDTLLAILIALAAAFITLTVELILKKRYAHSPSLDNNEVKSTHKNTSNKNSSYKSFTSSLNEKLDYELRNCIENGDDLTLFAMEFDHKLSNDEYREFYEELDAYFSEGFGIKDFVFKRGEKGIYVICPVMKIESGLRRAEEFQNRIIEKMPISFYNHSQLLIGISSCRGRAIDSKRLLFEVNAAIEKVLLDPALPIVAFKSDPDKYRNFVKRKV